MTFLKLKKDFFSKRRDISMKYFTILIFLRLKKKK